MLSYSNKKQVGIRKHQGKNQVQVSVKILKFLQSSIVYARASYCFDSLSTWECIVCHPINKVTHISFAGDFYNTVFAYIGYDASQNSIIVAFRGTRTMDGWIRDLMFYKSPDGGLEGSPDGVKVHVGFLKAWGDLKDKVVASVLELGAKYTEASVLVTGHSLGGAMASLAVIHLYNLTLTLSVKNTRKFTLYTIGSPRVGNDAFASWMSSFPFPQYRVIYQNDLVPHLPIANMGYTHGEIWIQGQETWDCGACTALTPNEENQECANSCRVLSVDAHQRIWGEELIGHRACYPSIPEPGPPVLPSFNSASEKRRDYFLIWCFGGLLIVLLLALNWCLKQKYLRAKMRWAKRLKQKEKEALLSKSKGELVSGFE